MVARGPRADAEQRTKIRAPRNRDPREAEAGPLVISCGITRAWPPPSVTDALMAMGAVALSLTAAGGVGRRGCRRSQLGAVSRRGSLSPGAVG